MNARHLISRIESREVTIGIIGMGYVGLPLALAASRHGFRVVGFDINCERVELLNRGSSPLKHIAKEVLVERLERRLFEATSDFSRLQSVDGIIICVPTPLNKHREPDLSFIEQTATTISQHLRRGQLVVLESTSYPGTTREIVKPILERSGLVCGRDFFLAFSPEREDPGNRSFSTSTIPKVIGADGADGLAVAMAFYSAFIAKVVPVSSMDTAEAVKILENVYRAVNIALVNELKIIYSKMGIDIFEVIEAARTKPFGFTPFYPGPGLGGHCIPIDPFYLTWKAREHGIDTEFIELAGRINSEMPQYVVDKLATAVDGHHGVGLSKSRILVVGVAYKKNIDDMRESPALVIFELLQMRGATVDYYDPYVPILPYTREHAKLAGTKSIVFDPRGLRTYHAVLVVTDHDDIDWRAIVENAQLIVDTRNATRKLGLEPKIAHVVYV